jgi:Lrp/AsnC family transcriptional regulator, leucine-responsive regulatory protein
MDDLDRKILKKLQVNGRKKNTDLARELGAAPSTMLERVRRLEERKVVQGYQAVIDPEKLGLAVQGFISITLDHHQKKKIRNLEEDIHNIPNVRACYHLTGRFDYLLHVAVKDLNQLGALVKNEITAIPGVGKVETFLVLSEVKHDEGWPIEI